MFPCMFDDDDVGDIGLGDTDFLCASDSLSPLTLFRRALLKYQYGSGSRRQLCAFIEAQVRNCTRKTHEVGEVHSLSVAVCHKRE